MSWCTHTSLACADVRHIKARRYVLQLPFTALQGCNYNMARSLLLLLLLWLHCTVLMQA
jgi:hypothetical protein